MLSKYSKQNRALFIALFLGFSLLSSPLFADNSSKKIRLYGELKENTPKRVSIKDIEKKCGYVEVSVYNPYEKKKDLYGGVNFKDFLKGYAKTNVKEVSLKAIDGYQVTFTKKEWSEIPIVIATRMNKEYIGFESKGPMRIVFPKYNPDSEVYKKLMSKWMWMITKVEFK